MEDVTESPEDLAYRAAKARRRRVIAAGLLAMFIGLPTLVFIVVDLLGA